MQGICRFTISRSTLAIASTLAGLFLGRAGPSRAETPQVLAWISADADGDGKPDTLTLRGDGTLQLEWAGRPATVLRVSDAPLLKRPAEVQFLATESGRFVLSRASEPGRGGAATMRALALLLRGAQPEVAYRGPVGPVGRDAEYSIELGLTPAGLLRYQTTPAVRRCDGETRLFVERYSAPGGFAPFAAATLPAPQEAAATESASLTATATPPSAYAGPPIGIYRFTAASAAAHVTRADQLGPPRELEDDSPLSAWAPPAAQLRGAFVTAQADGSGHAPRAIRLQAARGRPLPSQLWVILSQQHRYRVTLGPAPVQWLLLPAEATGDCVSLQIGEATDNAALGDAAIYSELDGPGGLAAIAAQVASSEGSRGEGAARTLLLRARRDAAGRQQVRAALASALGGAPQGQPEGLRRLDDLLLQLAEAEAGPGAGSGGSDGSTPDALLRQVVSRRLSTAGTSEDAPRTFLQGLAGYPRVGARLLLRISEDSAVSPELRGQALALWAALARTQDATATVKVVLSRLTEAQASARLGAGWQQALAAVLVCTQPNEAAQAAALSALDSQLAAVSAGRAGGNDPAVLSGISLLLSALSQAQARCPEAPQTTQLSERLAAAWPKEAADSQTAMDTPAFTLRYRLLQALDRLGKDTPGVQAVLASAAALPGEPVLRQLASRLRVRLKAATADGERLGGLRDSDAGVRLATLAALSVGDRPRGEDAPRLSPAELQRLDDTLRQDSWPKVRRAAAEARAGQCREAGPGVPPSRVEALRAALGDRDVELQRRALSAIARCEGSGAVDVFIQLAENAEAKAGLRGQACALLARHALAVPSLPGEQRANAHRAAATALADLLHDPVADDRHAAALSQCLRGLAEAGDASDLPTLIDAAGSDAPASLRQLALAAIGSICSRRPSIAGNPEPLPSKLQRSLKDVLSAGLANEKDERLQASARRVQALCQ